MGCNRQVFEEPRLYPSGVPTIAPPTIAACSELPTRTAEYKGGLSGGEAAYDAQGSTQLVG